MRGKEGDACRIMVDLTCMAGTNTTLKKFLNNFFKKAVKMLLPFLTMNLYKAEILYI